MSSHPVGASELTLGSGSVEGEGDGGSRVFDEVIAVVDCLFLEHLQEVVELVTAVAVDGEDDGLDVGFSELLVLVDLGCASVLHVVLHGALEVGRRKRMEDGDVEVVVMSPGGDEEICTFGGGAVDAFFVVVGINMLSSCISIAVLHGDMKVGFGLHMQSLTGADALDGTDGFVVPVVDGDFAEAWADANMFGRVGLATNALGNG